MSNNNVASIRGRLKNIADKERKPFDFILMLYLVERLLFRLSISRYNEQFVLKGGLLLYLIMDEKARATKDIDLLARGIASNLDMLKEIFADIAAISSDDAAIYDSESITAERIKEDADYDGVRIKIIAHLGRVDILQARIFAADFCSFVVVSSLHTYGYAPRRLLEIAKNQARKSTHQSMSTRPRQYTQILAV